MMVRYYYYIFIKYEKKFNISFKVWKSFSTTYCWCFTRFLVTANGINCYRNKLFNYPKIADYNRIFRNISGPRFCLEIIDQFLLLEYKFTIKIDQ